MSSDIFSILGFHLFLDFMSLGNPSNEKSFLLTYFYKQMTWIPFFEYPLFKVKIFPISDTIMFIPFVRMNAKCCWTQENGQVSIQAQTKNDFYIRKVDLHLQPINESERRIDIVFESIEGLRLGNAFRRETKFEQIKLSNWSQMFDCYDLFKIHLLKSHLEPIGNYKNQKSSKISVSGVPSNFKILSFNFRLYTNRSESLWLPIVQRQLHSRILKCHHINFPYTLVVEMYYSLDILKENLFIVNDKIV